MFTATVTRVEHANIRTITRRQQDAQTRPISVG
jgi:hypothetical protein